MNKDLLKKTVTTLSDTLGFLKSLYAFGVVGPNSPVYAMLQEQITKNQNLRDEINDTLNSKID